MRKINKQTLFSFCTIAILIFASILCGNSYAKKTYFAPTVYGEMKNQPSDNDCYPVIDACIQETCQGSFSDRTDTTGLYGKCSAYSTARISNYVTSCIGTHSVPDNIKYMPYCSKFVFEKVRTFVGSRDNINKQYQENTVECQMGKAQLEASTRCYAFTISQNPNTFNGTTLNQLYSMCGDGTFGGSNKMAEEFFTAGNYPTNSQQIIDGTATINSKMDDWKDQASAVQASYMALKQKSCLNDIYAMPNVQQETQQIDEKNNLIMNQISYF